jgi:hypothetical protein
VLPLCDGYGGVNKMCVFVSILLKFNATCLLLTHSQVSARLAGKFLHRLFFKFFFSTNMFYSDSVGSNLYEMAQRDGARLMASPGQSVMTMNDEVFYFFPFKFQLTYVFF